MNKHRKLVSVEVSVDRHTVDLFYALTAKLCPTPFAGIVTLMTVIIDISYDASAKKVGVEEWMKDFPDDVQSVVGTLLEQIKKERINAN